MSETVLDDLLRQHDSFDHERLSRIKKDERLIAEMRNDLA